MNSHESKEEFIAIANELSESIVELEKYRQTLWGDIEISLSGQSSHFVDMIRFRAGEIKNDGFHNKIEDLQIILVAIQKTLKEIEEMEQKINDLRRQK